MTSITTSTCVEVIHSLYEDGGKGSPSDPMKLYGQDYKQIKRSLLKENMLFEDETFPANLDSLGELEGFSSASEVEWLRPGEIADNPAFIVDGASRLDILQGRVGNCWFLSSIGALTFRKSLMAQVAPPDQSFKRDYAGIFHFKFWRFGKWVDIVIDDRLPTVDHVPVSVSSRTTNEFWAPLLEKAYAKVCGSYGDMIAGSPPEAFKDFSGGVFMSYTLAKSPPDLWDVMARAIQSGTMMGCGTFGGQKGEQICNKYGLVDGHAFAVTGAKQVESRGEKVNLVRIWNPWGRKEWNGDWSDKSELWDTVRDEDRNQCLSVRNDGEFWMRMKDFCVFFEKLDICCDSPNFVDGDAACNWKCSVKEGRWEVGKSAGGSFAFADEFWTNPQYRLTLKDTDEVVKGDRNVWLSLMQKPHEAHRGKVKYHSVCFHIYKVPPKAPKGKLPGSLFKEVGPTAVGDMWEIREHVECYHMEPGEYVVIPATADCNQSGDFIITIYSKAEAQIE